MAECQLKELPGLCQFQCWKQMTPNKIKPPSHSHFPCTSSDWQEINPYTLHKCQQSGDSNAHNESTARSAESLHFCKGYLCPSRLSRPDSIILTRVWVTRVWQMGLDGLHVLDCSLLPFKHEAFHKGRLHRFNRNFCVIEDIGVLVQHCEYDLAVQSRPLQNCIVLSTAQVEGNTSIATVLVVGQHADAKPITLGASLEEVTEFLLSVEGYVGNLPVGVTVRFAPRKCVVLLPHHTALLMDPVLVMLGALDHTTDVFKLKRTLVQKALRYLTIPQLTLLFFIAVSLINLSSVLPLQAKSTQLPWAGSDEFAFKVMFLLATPRGQIRSHRGQQEKLSKDQEDCEEFVETHKAPEYGDTEPEGKSLQTHLGCTWRSSSKWKTTLDGKVEVVDENPERLGSTFRTPPPNRSQQGEQLLASFLSKSLRCPSGQAFFFTGERCQSRQVHGNILGMTIEVLSELHDLALAVLQLSKEYALEVFSVEEVDGSEEDTLYLPAKRSTGVRQVVTANVTAMVVTAMTKGHTYPRQNATAF
ncbi:hypothetical protein EK904_012061 [Melospiza melodia maxima]|nr:hypothetical protein EK904_012061 [Melospiza melodia maxima]